VTSGTSLTLASFRIQFSLCRSGLVSACNLTRIASLLNFQADFSPVPAPAFRIEPAQDSEGDISPFLTVPRAFQLLPGPVPAPVSTWNRHEIWPSHLTSASCDPEHPSLAHPRIHPALPHATATPLHASDPRRPHSCSGHSPPSLGSAPPSLMFRPLPAQPRIRAALTHVPATPRPAPDPRRPHSCSGYSPPSPGSAPPSLMFRQLPAQPRFRTVLPHVPATPRHAHDPRRPPSCSGARTSPTCPGSVPPRYRLAIPEDPASPSPGSLPGFPVLSPPRL
jgi:hypothetical protein